MKELTVFLEKMAVALGINIDRLWSALLKQAPITGAIELIQCIFLVFISYFIFLFVRKKTTPQAENVYSEWEDEFSVVAWCSVFIFSFIVCIFIFKSANSIIAAFFNPEYWALTKILKSGCK